MSDLKYTIIESEEKTTFDFSTDFENSEEVDLEVDEEYRKELKEKYNIDLDTPEGKKAYGDILQIVLEKIRQEANDSGERGTPSDDTI